MGKSKITVTIDENLVDDLDYFAEKLREKRSQLVEKALRLWRKSQLERELEEGYRAMAQENLELAEDNLEASSEVLS